MSQHNATRTLSVVASEPVDKYLRINQDGTIAGATDLDVGVTRVRAESDQPVGIHAVNLQGTVNIITQSSTVAGDLLYTASGGQVSPVKTLNSMLRGIAMEDGDAGTVIEVLNLVFPVDQDLADYQGVWDAGANTPSLSETYSGSVGDFYIVASGGTRSLGDSS